MTVAEAPLPDDLLKALHLLTRDGKLNADAARKLKQVRHLIQLIRPALGESARIIDVGAGKSYLGFLLYNAFLKDQPETSLISIETRGDLVEKSRALAKRLGFDRMEFVESAIDQYQSTGEVGLVTALHACDTATDDAILLGVRAQARFIALVPCCQAEVARLLAELPLSTLSLLWKHPIHRRELGSHLTNVLRVLFLEAWGYRVSVTELVGWEHSMKNEFIFAERLDRPAPEAQKRWEEFHAVFPIQTRLVKASA